MSNQLRRLLVQNTRLDPIESELHLVAEVARRTPATRLRGRLVGPRCAYASTLEVAYLVREPRRDLVPPTPDTVAGRVVLPEAAFWDPERPFLYHATVELWEGDTLVEQATRTHGLRVARLTPHGLRWNGQPLSLRGVARDSHNEGDAANLRRAGCNTLLAPISRPELWQQADRLGFLVLGLVTSLAERDAVGLLEAHPCTLGFVLAETVWARSPDPAAVGKTTALVGLEWTARAPSTLPAGAAFALLSAENVTRRAACPLPRILVFTDPVIPDSSPEPLSTNEVILGCLVREPLG